MVTHTAVAVARMLHGTTPSLPRRIRRTTRFVRASTSTTEKSDRLVTHTEPAPTESASGRS